MVRSAECGVQTFHDFSAHATGFSQWGTRGTGQGTWDLTDFSERRIHSAKNSGGRISQCAEKFLGSAGALPSKTIRHSLLAIRCRFPVEIGARLLHH